MKILHTCSIWDRLRLHNATVARSVYDFNLTLVENGAKFNLPDIDPPLFPASKQKNVSFIFE